MARSKHAARRFVAGVGAVGVFAVVGAIAFTANQGRIPGTPATVARAAFQDVGELTPGAEVRESGINVGQVSAVDLVNGTPVVTMTLTGGVPLRHDAYAGIWDQSALAQKYVELRPGTPGSGELGSEVLPVSQTESTHDLNTLLDVFDAPTRTGLSTMLRQFGGGLAGYGPGLHQFVATAPTNLADISSISDNLTSAQTNLVGLMRSTDRLSGRFQNREEQITELLSRTDTTLRAIATDNSVPLSSTLAKLPTTLHAVRGAVDDIRQPLIDVGDATGHLRSGSVALGNATPDVRGVFQEAPDPLHLVPDVSDDAQPAVEDLTHTVSDARPFVSRLGDGLGSASEPLGVLAPYSLDIGTFFHDIGSLVSNHDGWQHRLRIMTGPPLAPSFLPQQIQDAHNAYPAPGRATLERDRSGGLIPGS